MSFDFPLILLSLTAFAGAVAVVDWLWQVALVRKAAPPRTKLPLLIEYCRSFFPVLVIVLLLRSFVAQPNRVPTGSLEPTVMPGDLLLVLQYPYGLKMPVWNNQLIAIGHPKRGEIALFSHPVDPSVTLVKRVVGLPGDHISYINKVFYIDGKEMKQTFIKDTIDKEPTGNIPVKEYSEDLMGVKHKIIINSSVAGHNFYNLVVPQGEYFMIGDNRDNSDDSRYWGFVPVRNFFGKAVLVWMNFDTNDFSFNWRRIGTVL